MAVGEGSYSPEALSIGITLLSLVSAAFISCLEMLSMALSKVCVVSLA